MQLSLRGFVRASGVLGAGAPRVTKTQRLTVAPAGRHAAAAAGAEAPHAAAHPTATRLAATRRPVRLFGIAVELL